MHNSKMALIEYGFQFQYGAIKIEARAYYDDAVSSFNSNMVRLK